MKLNCRQKQQKKAGCGGYVEDTTWTDHSGTVRLFIGVQGGYYDAKYFDKGVEFDAPGVCGRVISNVVRDKILETIPVLP